MLAKTFLNYLKEYYEWWKFMNLVGGFKRFRHNVTLVIIKYDADSMSVISFSTTDKGYSPHLYFILSNTNTLGTNFN